MKFYMKENFTIIIQMLYNITILLNKECESTCNQLLQCFKNTQLKLS